MNIKQTIKHLFIGAFMVVGLVGLTGPAVFAAETKKCADVDTSLISCEQSGEGGNIENSGLWGLLVLTINILTAGVGLAALGGIVYGAILYTSAGGSQEQTKKALGIITNVVIGVIAYALMYTGLNFIIPGGVFG